MKAKLPTPKKRHSKGEFHGGAPGGIGHFSCRNLTPAQSKAFHAAYNAPEAMAYRRKLIFPADVHVEGVAGDLLVLSDTLTDIEDSHARRASRFSIGAFMSGYYEDLEIEKTRPPRNDAELEASLKKDQAWFYQTIGEELHQWIQDRDASSFRRLAELLDKVPDTSLAGAWSETSDFVHRTFHSRPTLGIVVWHIFLMRLGQNRPALAPNKVFKAGGADGMSRGVPTKAELREHVEKAWEELGKDFSPRDFTRELSRLGLSGLPSAPPLKKNITRGR